MLFLDKNVSNCISNILLRKGRKKSHALKNKGCVPLFSFQKKRTNLQPHGCSARVCVLGCGEQSELGNHMNKILFHLPYPVWKRNLAGSSPLMQSSPLNTTSQVIHLLSKHSIAS